MAGRSRLRILHIDAPFKRFVDMLSHPEGDRLLTCLSSLRTLVSLNVSIHLLSPTLAGLQNGEGKPHQQEVLKTLAFLAQCPDILQSIYFLGISHPTSLGLSRGENVKRVSRVAL